MGGARLMQAEEGGFRAMRESMVTIQIEGRGVSDPRVLDAMRKVPRHRFVLPDTIAEAYDDHPLPIGHGQTISQPYIVAYMCELAQLKDTHRVLEVGTGSGYHAAIMAQVVSEVYTVEIVPELATHAGATIAKLGYGSIHVRQADGYLGWPEAAPFDAIIVTAAADHIPPPLIEQLKEGGRMVIPIGHPFFTQQLVVVEKEHGQVSSRQVLPVRFVPLTGGH
jgi:protein-L-isoaspartate(D-aspartate) O-methyltransferase